MFHIRTLVRRFGVVAAIVSLAVLAPACGGGTSGPGPGGAGQGLVLVGFLQAGVDNLAINTVLEFSFSEPVDPSTITSGSIQIREGPDFGATAAGAFNVAGDKVLFEPVLPTDCALQTAGFKPGTTYRIVLVGYPEEFSIKNSKGQPLDRTTTYEVTTLPETAEDVLEDQKPGQAPTVISSTPVSGEAAATIETDGEITIEFSENIDPCSISGDTVLCALYEVGDPDTFEAAPNGNMSGFVPVEDSSPGDPYTWGASNSTPVDPAQSIPVERVLEQTRDATRLRIRPLFGELPDNCLIVVHLTFGILDFGGTALPTTTFSFTTENRTAQASQFTIKFDETTPVDKAVTTADINTARSPSRAQGWLLFAGDGDNGGSTLPDNLKPAFPASIDDDCTVRPNSGFKTAFDPTVDVNLDTGSSRNRLCTNSTDGSTGVVWEFSTFRIRSGVTVRVLGENPALILVQGDILIENGGRLLVRGDKQNGAPDGRGGAGHGYNYPSYTTPQGGKGGIGVAGGGDGGASHAVGSTKDGDDGWAGYASPDYDTGSEEGGVGAGEGNVGATSTTYAAGCSGGGGGGGHAVVGSDGGSVVTSTVSFDDPARGGGGEVYPDGANADKMYQPQAGSGAGAGGENRYSFSYYYDAPAGAGGAGGGFVDLTAGGSIQIFGTIDAAGSRGGNGGTGGYGNYLGAGGGGGGSGGGIRLLTPNDIDISGATITAAGGAGGTGGVPNLKPADFVRNDGGAGGAGRIVMEDGDSIIAGYANAQVLPGEGQDGFYRGPFDATRFQGGGLEPVAVTDLMLVGPVTPPTFETPTLSDFVAGIPVASSNGAGMTSMLLEVQGYTMLPDGTADLSSGTGWYTVGYFTSTVTGAGFTEGSQPPDVTIPSDNVGVGMANVNGSQFLQVRIEFWLPSGIAATQAGPYIDDWNVRFEYDN